MKQFAIQNDSPVNQRAAAGILETVPLVMRAVRSVMRSHGTQHLSIPQFRTLGYLHRHGGASLSEAAQHIGLRPPTMSKMIDVLVGRGLVERDTHVDDRRRVTLRLSAAGRELWQRARQATHSFLIDKLAELGDEDLFAILRAMECLRELFPAGHGPQGEGEG